MDKLYLEKEGNNIIMYTSLHINVERSGTVSSKY